MAMNLSDSFAVEGSPNEDTFEAQLRLPISTNEEGVAFVAHR